MNANPTQHPNRNRARGAFAAEQLRMRHYHRALACVNDHAQRSHWSRELDASRGRAARLAIALAEMGEAVPASEPGRDSACCLMEAMEMALSNGDMAAAEVVALECMRLIDLRCDLLRDESGSTPAPAIG